MELLILVLRTVLIYIIIYVTMRIMGKREIGKLSIFDLVISIMIAEIAVFVLEDVNKPMIEGLVPMATLVAVQLLMAYISLKNENIRRWIDSKPSIIVQGGKLNRSEMARQRYNLDDLLLQLRENRVMNPADVEFAILEPSGKLTVQKKQSSEPEGKATKETKQGFRYEGLPLPLIMDGRVQDESLAKLDKTRFWLKRELQSRGVKDFKDVFFCSVDHKGHWFIDKKR